MQKNELQMNLEKPKRATEPKSLEALSISLGNISLVAPREPFTGNHDAHVAPREPLMGNHDAPVSCITVNAQPSGMQAVREKLSSNIQI
jgi:hypothetical protein